METAHSFKIVEIFTTIKLQAETNCTQLCKDFKLKRGDESKVLNSAAKKNSISNAVIEC